MPLRRRNATQRSNANAMQCNTMQRAQLFRKMLGPEGVGSGSQRKKEDECVFVSISGSVILCRTGSLVRSTRCAGTEYKGGIAIWSQSSRRLAWRVGAVLRRDVGFRAGSGGVEQ
jgi:hypothetical protein